MTANKPTHSAKPSKDTIYLDVDDEVTSIIDKVESASQKVVALVLPKRATSLQSIVNMRLLKRSADNAGKNVVLITSEAALMPLAGVAGLHVAKSLQSKPVIPPSPLGSAVQPAVIENASLDDQIPEEEIDLDNAKLDYDQPIGELAAVPAEEATIALGDEASEAAAAKPPTKKPSKNKKLGVPNFDRFRLLLILGGAGIAGLFIFIWLAVGVLPHAKIVLHTSSTPVSADFKLTASGAAKTLDEVKKVIPSSLKSADQISTQQAQATGQKNLGEKASGSVSMSATKCAPNIGQPSDVPAGTGISSGSLTYITQTTVTFTINGGSGSCVNYKGTSSTTVTAQKQGSQYNIGKSDFTVSGYSGISANGGPMSGGTDNIVTVVTDQDIATAKAKLTSADTDKFSKDFQDKLGDDVYALTSTLKISDPAVTSSPAVGQQASTATVTIKITHTILTLQKADLEKILTTELTNQIDKTKQRLSPGDVLDGINISIQNQASPTDAALSVSKDTTAVPIIDDVSIKNQVKGKKSGDIKTMLASYPGVKSVDVHLSPFWVSKTPNKISKIKVVLQEVKQSK